MKTTLSLLFATWISFLGAQADSITYRFPRIERSAGLAFEAGRSFDYATDLNDMNYLTKLTKHNSKGISLFYEQQLNTRKGWGFSAGIGANVTFFTHQLSYRNPSFDILSSTQSDSITYNSDPKYHDYWPVTSLFLALDLPLTVSYAVPVTSRLVFRPYAGIKIRNILFVPYEDRNSTESVWMTENDSTFTGKYDMDYGTFNSRVVLLFTTGVKASYLLKNGGSLNVFADYSFGLFNHFEMYLSRFNSKENISVYNHSTHQTTQEDVNYTLPYTVYLSMNMSHLRVGASYSFPERKAVRATGL